MSTATATTSTPRPGYRNPSFGSTFNSEWKKLNTARAPRRNLLLGTLLGIGFSALLALIIGNTWSDWPPEERAAFNPILYPLAGSLFVAIFYSAVGVNSFMSEYSSGMIRQTLTATPKRGRVLAAKALVVTLATLVCGIIVTVGMLVVGNLIFGAYDLPTADFGSSDAIRSLVLLSITTPLFPVIAVALAVLLRSTAGALSTTLALIFAPGIIGSFLPRWWQENVVSLLPGPASDSLSIGHLEPSLTHLDEPAATAVVIVWLVALLALAYFKLSRRDA